MIAWLVGDQWGGRINRVWMGLGYGYLLWLWEEEGRMDKEGGERGVKVLTLRTGGDRAVGEYSCVCVLINIRTTFLEKRKYAEALSLPASSIAQYMDRMSLRFVV
jgi:hypothetical protein